MYAENLHMYAENESAMKRNNAILTDLTGEFYMIEAKDKISDSCKCPLATIEAAQNQEQTNTGDSVKCLS